MTAVVYVPCLEPAGPDEPVQVVCAQPQPQPRPGTPAPVPTPVPTPTPAPRRP